MLPCSQGKLTVQGRKEGSKEGREEDTSSEERRVTMMLNFNLQR